ncbi:MAG: hypothetical protein BA870_06180 [Desulfuromonadales bacterium C00003094]|nr:MAG: hypothetical protein BA870_06180 [Desulfuromonadales bacterium C00003094]
MLAFMENLFYWGRLKTDHYLFGTSLKRQILGPGKTRLQRIPLEIDPVFKGQAPSVATCSRGGHE